MKVMAFDLEMAQPSSKIIQLGYALGDTDTGEVVKYPGIWTSIDEDLDEFIIRLCHIDVDEYHAQKVTLEEAYKQMALVYKQNDCSLNVVTWGAGDTTCLRGQLSEDGHPWVFGRRWVDTKTLAQTYFVANNMPFPGGLAKSMGKLGLRFKGTKHRADDDAYNTMIVFLHLLNKFKNLRQPVFTD